MLEKLTKTITQFFGIIAGSLSGLGAVLTAAGYLVERSHLKMLGFTNIPVDLNQYLYTGALFFAFLPSIIIARSITILLYGWTLLLLSLFTIWRLSLKFDTVSQLSNKLKERIVNLVQHRNLAFIFLLLAQLTIIYWLFQATGIENLLFTKVKPLLPEIPGFLSINSTYLESLILYKVHDRLEIYFCQLFLLTFACGILYRFIIANRKNNSAKLRFSDNIWLGMNLILLTTQFLLIPINYGVLLLDKRYPEVMVRFDQSKKGVATAPQFNDIGIQRTADKAKIRNQILPLDDLPFIRDLKAAPHVFAGMDYNSLEFFAKSDSPKIAKVTVKGSILNVFAVSEGKAKITIIAKDRIKNIDSTAFNVQVARMDNSVPDLSIEIADTILTVGGSPITLAYFDSFIQADDVDGDTLSFTAILSAPNVAAVQMNENLLSIFPVSAGKTTLTLAANDGKGGTSSKNFDVIVLSKVLEWPKEDRLILLYESSGVFYLYSKLERRIWYVRSADIHSMVYYGRVGLFEKQ